MLLNDPAFELPAEPPFPVGTSPFRQKGQVYLGNHEYLDSCVAGGYEAVRRAVPLPQVGAFFEQRFAASEWYDAMPNAYLQATAAKMRGLSFHEHGRQLSAWHARSRMNGIYRALLSVLSTENVAMWAPRISSIYYSFGKFTATVAGPRRIACVRAGVPRLLVPWIAATMHGMGEETLSLSGARGAKISFGEITPDGSLSGHPLFAIGAELSWL